MDLYDFAERIMGMDDATWARHANPWSVLTRIPILPLLSLSVWSRVVLGWWALLPIGLLLVWTWLNPRIFPPPTSLDNWASKGVLGERIWLQRRSVPVPVHHARAIRLIMLTSAFGTVLLFWGLIQLHLWLTLLGLSVAMLAKLWFVDRMVWLYEDMRHLPPYAGWRR